MVDVLFLAEHGKQPKTGSSAYHAESCDRQRREFGKRRFADGCHQAPQHVGTKGKQVPLQIFAHASINPENNLFLLKTGAKVVLFSFRLPIFALKNESEPNMEIQANYIKRIEIHGLWHRFDIAWDLRPDVNILAGINGVGKTTILNRSVLYLEQTSGEVKTDERNGVRVCFDKPEATYIPYDVIRSYDRPLVMGDFTARMADPEVKSELDWQLYLLQRRYLDYQVNVGNKMIELLNGTDEQRAQAPTLSLPKRKFQDMIDNLFSYTGKTIDRKSNDIVFYQNGERLSPYRLSSGEKQMVLILLTVLVREGEHSVLFMDEPEASLHIEWQQKLIGMIRELNPDLQLILTTHSPAVIMEGWLDAVTEVSDISTLSTPVNKP